MTFGVNTSPFAGREGEFCTTRQLRKRLYKELETNLSLRVQDTDSADAFLVKGRGELHLAVLIETMRREGYEFEVSKPEAITKVVNGILMEPVEDLLIDTREDFYGIISEMLSKRQAELVDMRSDEDRIWASFSPPAKQTVTHVPQPTTSTLLASPISVLSSARGFCSAVIMGYTSS